MRHETHVTDLLPGYALGCLDAEETAMVVEHLTDCGQCRTEWEAFQAIGDQLALAAPDAQPSPGLKRRILRNIQSEKRSTQAQTFFSGWGHWFVTLFQPVAPFWAVASLLLIVMLGTSTLMLWQRIHSLEVLYQTQDFQMVTLQCTHVAPEATGQIMISRDGEFGILTVAHLPVLESEYIYQVWLKRNGERTPGGTFSVNQNGYGVMKLISPESLLDCGFSITVEPAEGSSAPSGTPLLESMVS